MLFIASSYVFFGEGNSKFVVLGKKRDFGTSFLNIYSNLTGTKMTGRHRRHIYAQLGPRKFAGAFNRRGRFNMLCAETRSAVDTS